MKRRTFIATGSLALSGGITGSVLGLDPSGMIDKPRPEYRDDDHVAYERDGLELRTLQETVSPGDTIGFEVSNTSDSETVLGCHNPWAIQKRGDGEWYHVTWTSSRYHLLCGTAIPQGDSLVERLTLSESWLETNADDVHTELTPGQYRFLLVGTSPFLAVDFRIRESE